MNIGEQIKKAREAKGLSRKEVATALKMDASQYSKIELGRVDPQFSTIEKIAGAIGVDVVDLINANDVFKDITSYDKTIVEKIQLLEQLEETEKKSVFAIIDGLFTKQKLKLTLSDALGMAK